MSLERSIPRGRLIFFIVLDIILVVVAFTAFRYRARLGDGAQGTDRLLKPGAMNLTSSAFSDGEQIPVAHTCDGRGLGVPLAWTGVPAGAKSLAFTLRDPDAPMGEWTHWLRWDYPAADGELTPGLGQLGREGVNSANERGWYAPCPPFGSHRYVFTVYALDTFLQMPESSSVTDLLRVIDGHVLGSATLTGRYQRVQR